jgi:hypothetical protein
VQSGSYRNPNESPFLKKENKNKKSTKAYFFPQMLEAPGVKIKQNIAHYKKTGCREWLIVGKLVT